MPSYNQVMKNGKTYVVLFEYSPNGRDDRGEFRAEVAGSRCFAMREAACLFVKSRYEKAVDREREDRAGLDASSAEALSDDDMKAMGYSWEADFSRFGFEYESQYPDVRSEPKYSWTVVELDLPEDQGF
jgi:hypothetical protein